MSIAHAAGARAALPHGQLVSALGRATQWACKTINTERRSVLTMFAHTAPYKSLFSKGLQRPCGPPGMRMPPVTEDAPHQFPQHNAALGLTWGIAPAHGPGSRHAPGSHPELNPEFSARARSALGAESATTRCQRERSSCAKAQPLAGAATRAPRRLHGACVCRALATAR